MRNQGIILIIVEEIDCERTLVQTFARDFNSGLELLEIKTTFDTHWEDLHNIKVLANFNSILGVNH